MLGLNLQVCGQGNRDLQVCLNQLRSQCKEGLLIQSRSLDLIFTLKSYKLYESSDCCTTFQLQLVLCKSCFDA